MDNAHSVIFWYVATTDHATYRYEINMWLPLENTPEQIWLPFRSHAFGVHHSHINPLNSLSGSNKVLPDGTGLKEPVVKFEINPPEESLVTRAGKLCTK